MKKIVREEEDKWNGIEKEVQELKKEVSMMSAMLSDHIRLNEKAPELFAGSAHTEDVNLFALQTVSELRSGFANQINDIKITSNHLGPYRETLSVLKLANKGCTAEEVSKETKRSRNLESGYMYRLYLAGVLKRFKEGKKVKYILSDIDF